MNIYVSVAKIRNVNSTEIFFNEEHKLFLNLQPTADDFFLFPFYIHKFQ